MRKIKNPAECKISIIGGIFKANYLEVGALQRGPSGSFENMIEIIGFCNKLTSDLNLVGSWNYLFFQIPGKGNSG
jgi:hypothetical protein